MKISKTESAKYSKQIILKNIGIIGQKKILSSKVLVIGAGGLGCPLLLYLSNLGIKNLGVVDYDKIELSNLNRQVLFNYGDIGKFKSILNHKNTLVGKMIIFNTLNLNFRITKLSKSLDCVSECKKR